MRFGYTYCLLLWLMSCDSKPVAQSRPQAAARLVKLTPAHTLAPTTTPTDSLATFRWEDVCTHTGTYNSNKYTRQQLTDTYQLVLGVGGLPTSLYLSSTDDKVTSFRQLTALLKQQHDSLASVLHQKSVVPTVFWHQFKHLRELQLAEQYEQAQAELNAYFAPAMLPRSRYYAACTFYADALASTDTTVVLGAWRHLIAQQKKTNADPAQFDQEYAAVATSPDRLHYATLQIITFGLHNCLISSSKYNNLDDKYQPQEKFLKLFQSVQRSNCADTD